MQIPGPSNTPERIRRAMSRPTIDHRGPEFAILTENILKGLQEVFRTRGPVVIYPSSGTGAWEAALFNLFSPGDRVLAFETGHFAGVWKKVAEKLGLEVAWVKGDWRHGVNPLEVFEKLKQDKGQKIKGLMVVHNETSNGITSDIKGIREAMNQANHTALLLVDVVSSLATDDFRQDEWGVDVAIGASQKGLMMPPGLGFNALSSKALHSSKRAKALHSYWQWDRIIDMNETGYFPYTPASSLLFGLEEAISMLREEGLQTAIKRHQLFARACRRAASCWGLENQCLNAKEYSNSTTALRIPNGFDSNELRKIIFDGFDMSLGKGLGQLNGKVFRIGHLGDFNELMLIATLSGVEMGLTLMGIPFQSGGVQGAMQLIAEAKAEKTDPG